MKLLVLHISDLHLRSKDDPVLARIRLIPPALQDLEPGVAGCLVLVSGDVAFSGTEEQYGYALDALVQLREEIRGVLSLDGEVSVLVVAGNHDCDFGGTRGARDALVSRLAAEDPVPIDESVIAICLEVQDGFASFAELLHDRPTPTPDRLYVSFDMRFEGHAIRVHLLNTAWVSRLNEQQGALYFPESVLPDQRGDGELELVVMHHPYGWFESSNARALRKRIERIADVVLTGHEHDFTLRFISDGAGRGNEYIEGGAMQEHGAEESAFNVMVFDLANQRQKMVPFVWRDSLYVPKRELPVEWLPYQMAQLREERLFEFSATMRDYLEDPGAAIRHPVAGDLKRSHLHTPPDFREVRYDSHHPQGQLRGEELVEFATDHPHILITGPDKCGKTMEAKELVSAFRARGLIPVLLSGKRQKWAREEDVVVAINNAFKEQYSPEHLEQYRQLPLDRKVVICDDFHLIRFRPGARKPCIAQLLAKCATAVLFSHDIASQVGDLIEGAGLGGGTGDFKHFGFLPFGHRRRGELIEKWLTLDPAAAERPGELSREVIAVKRIMDTAIGTNFVPAFPVFLIPMLQAFQHGKPADVAASTYGYFYELLIREALAVELTKEEFDIYVHYLAFLANEIHLRKKGVLAEAELREIHAAFEAERMLQVPFVDTVGHLTRRHVLVKSDQGYSFKYPYYGYYFLALHLRDHIEDEAVRRRIRELTRQLEDEDAANVLLFLAHVSKSAFIVEEPLDAAGDVMRGVHREELTRQIAGAVAIEREAIQLAVEDRPVRETRREMLERLDELDDEAGDDVAEEVDDYLRLLGKAFKTLQILGQMLKSFPGSMPAVQKLALVRACRDLGMRILGSMVATIQEAKDDVVAAAVESLRSEYPGIAIDELRERVAEAMFVMLHFTSYGVVRRVSLALGSAHLGPVYDVVTEEEQSPFMQLVRVGLRLDHASGFPVDAVTAAHDGLKENALAHLALCRLVANHFHLFEEPVKVRQSICAKLGIPLRPTVSRGGRTKLLAAPSKG